MLAARAAAAAVQAAATCAGRPLGLTTSPFSTGAGGLADSILAFVRGGQAASADAAVDVLQTGLASSASPLDAARLRVAWAEVEAGRDAWRAAADQAKAAAAADAGGAADPLAAAVHAAAVDAHVRACLTAGWDGEAADAAAAAAAGDGWRAVACHAAADAAGAADAAAAVRAVAGGAPSAAGNDVVDGGLARAWAAVRAGGVLFASSTSSSSSGCEDAEHLFEEAAAALAVAAPLTAPSGPATRGAALAASHAGRAQVLLARRDWAGAEDAAAAALAAATGEGGGRGGESAAATPCPSPAAAAGPLLLLGDTFARRAQLTVAEGLYRRAALDAGMADAGGGGGGGSGRVWARDHGAAHPPTPPVHPSLAAAAAWRLAQLLTLVPRRSTEAGRWAAAAAGVGGDGEAGLARALGPLDGLKGGVVAGSAAPWVDVACRRVLPRLDG